MQDKNQAFTLTELMIVVVILGIMAGFAIPNYQRAIVRAHERDAVIQLTALNAANLIFYTNNNNQYGGPFNSLQAINAGLGINIIANDMTYAYNLTAPTTYNATAQYGANFTIRVNETAVSGTNPCCVTAGSCRTIPNC